MNERAVAVARFGTTAEASATTLESRQGAASMFLKGPVVGICLGVGSFQRGTSVTSYPQLTWRESSAQTDRWQACHAALWLRLGLAFLIELLGARATLMQQAPFMGTKACVSKQ